MGSDRARTRTRTRARARAPTHACARSHLHMYIHHSWYRTTERSTLHNGSRTLAEPWPIIASTQTRARARGISCLSAGGTQHAACNTGGGGARSESAGEARLGEVREQDGRARRDERRIRRADAGDAGAASAGTRPTAQRPTQRHGTAHASCQGTTSSRLRPRGDAAMRTRARTHAQTRTDAHARTHAHVCLHCRYTHILTCRPSLTVS